MRSMYETEKTLNQCSYFIMHMRIDQKSMPPSNKKRELKNRIVEYSEKYYHLEQKFKQMQLKFKSQNEQEPNSNSDSSSSGDDEKRLNSSCDMEFEDHMQVEGGAKKKQNKNKGLSSSQKQIEKQNQLIQEALKMGMSSHQLSQQANIELRSQRDQIINIVGLVRDIGFDLIKADKLATDINYRRLLNIVMLYVIIGLLFICIVLMLYYKLQHSWMMGLMPVHNQMAASASVNSTHS